MKTEFKLLQTRMLCGVAWVVLGLSLAPVTAADSNFTDANWSSMGGFPGANGCMSNNGPSKHRPFFQLNPGFIRDCLS